MRKTYKNMEMPVAEWRELDDMPARLWMQISVEFCGDSLDTSYMSFGR